MINQKQQNVIKRWGFLAILCMFSQMAQGAKDQLLVVHGGWGSCFNGFSAQSTESAFQNALKQLRAGFGAQTPVRGLYTCLKVATIDQPQLIPYIYIDEKGRANQGTWSSDDMDLLVKRITQKYPSEISLVGHSHGAWLAMKTLPKLPPVASLFTIEPISPENCGIQEFLENRDRPILQRRQKIVDGCRQAPADINADEVSHLIQDDWFNFYQDPNFSMTALHSSEIPEAQNFPKYFGGGQRAHMDAAYNADVWRKIIVSILK